MTQEFHALGSDRSAQFVRAFLDHFLPHREACSDEYSVPENADRPKVVFRTEREILRYLEQHPDEPHGLYWNDSSPASRRQAMVFHTRDGKVVYGLAEDASSPAELLRELAVFVGAEYSILGSEQRPPDTAQEFIALCERSSRRSSRDR